MTEPEVSVDPDPIPEELKERPQWLMWDASADAPRRPHWRGDFQISWSDPDDWHTFEEAVEAASERPEWGIGYVCALENDDYPPGVYGCLDLDGVLQSPEGRSKEWVPSLEAIFAEAPYAEYSPGDDGIHIPIVGQEPPEWWSDSHFTDEEHEGVEYLTNKFVTFTGNVLGGAGNHVAEADPTPFLYDAYTVLNDEEPGSSGGSTSLSSSDGSGGGGDDGDEYLEESDIEDALDAIDADLSYPEWRNIGFALHDFFDGGQRGQALFESWSRGGSKWDDQADYYAERIYGDAEQGGGIGVGTLIHHAKKGGWEPPAPQGSGGYATPEAPAESEAEEATDGGTTLVESDSGTDGPDLELAPWAVAQVAHGDANGPYRTADEAPAPDDMKKRHRAYYTWRLAERLDADHHVGIPGGPIYSYGDGQGIWTAEDKQGLRELGTDALAFAYDTGVRRELEERVRAERPMHADDLGAPAETVAVGNGLLNLRERSVRPLKPEDYALSRAPVEFDPDAECPEFRAFIRESVTEEDRKKLQEYAGYLLWHHAQPFGKALFIVGPTDSGKGAFLRILKGVLGAENLASESLQSLIETRWGCAHLYGTWANIRNEVSPRDLGHIERFKEMTGGGDRVSAEFKGDQKFQFDVFQKFLFAMNQMPEVQNADPAFWNRVLFAEFPDTVPDEEQDPTLDDRIVKEEGSGVLNWMLAGLERLLENQRFTGERDQEGKKEMAGAWGGTFDRFLRDAVEVTHDAYDIVSKGDLYALANAYAEDIGKESEWDSQQGFTRDMKEQPGIGDMQTRALTEGAGQNNVYTGVVPDPEVIEDLDVDVGYGRRDGGADPATADRGDKQHRFD
jgi:putative DNA primase/helicase